MTEPLNHAAYCRTKELLANMESRRARLRERTDLHPSVRTAAERSYIDMMRQYKRNIKLYEIAHPETVSPPPVPRGDADPVGQPSS